MNRRVLYTLFVLLVGLMIGLIVSRLFVPDRYGVLTLVLFALGGALLGALGMGLILAPRAAGQPGITPPPSWTVRVAGRRLTVRLEPAWWANLVAADQGPAGGWRTLWDAHWNPVPASGGGLLLAALSLALLAQLLIVGRQLVPGLALYALVGLAVILWVWRRRLDLFAFLDGIHVGRRAELLLVTFVLLTAFGARLVQVGSMPVGIDGDELKWTAQAYFDLVAHQQAGDFAGQQRYTPVSFLADKLAFDIWGVDINSPRIMTALLSALATIVFYFLARDMFNVPVALVATLLMATSYYDVNTSRQAVVETFTKLPMLLAVWLLVRGVDRQRWPYFLLCGVTLYVGIMTYDTFFVVPPVILLYLLYRGLRNWRRAYRWGLYLLLVVGPMLLAVPIVQETVQGRQYTYVKGVASGVAELTNANTLRPLFDNAARALSVLFQSLQGTDYALNWDGPLVNPLVLIFAVIGLALVLARLTRRHNLLLVLWFLFCFFPAPVLSGYTVPRVLYIALPPILLLGGVGFVAAAVAARALPMPAATAGRLVAAALVVALGAVVLTDVLIYNAQLRNQADWLKRRFFVNTLKQSVQNAPLTLLPVTRGSDDFVWGNAATVPFIAYSATRDPDVNRRVRLLTFTELPGVLGTLANNYDRVNVLHDTGLADPLASQTIDTLKRCYGDVATRTGSFFSTYTIQRDALQAPNCYSLTGLHGVAPGPADALPANEPLTFQWESGSDRPTAQRVQVEERNAGLVWLEGEDFERANGWMFEAKADHYPGFSGSGYLLDDVRAGETRARALIPAPGHYDVWVRWLRNTTEGHRTFLTVGGVKFEFARTLVPLIPGGSPPQLSVWNWERVGSVDLVAGLQDVILSRQYSELAWKPVQVDALFLSSDPTFNPDQDQLWSTIVDTGQVDSAAQEYVLESGLKPGVYRWRVQLSDGDKLVDARGKKGVWSDLLEFRVE